MIFALTLLPIMGMTGATVEYSLLASTRSKLQSAADAAALAGASAMASKADQIVSVQEAAGSAAATAVADSLAPDAQETVTATASQKSVKVQLAQTQMMIWGGFFGSETTSIAAESTAVFNNQTVCVTLLEPSAGGLLLNSDSELNSNCGVHVNSTSTQAVQVNTTSKIKARSTCVVGSVFLNGGTITPAAKTGCAKRNDPLATLPEPLNTTNACDHTEIVVQTGHSRTLNPGVYCTKFDVNGGTVTLNPGVYIIRDMELVVNSGGKLIGDNVMLFFMGKSGRLIVNSDSLIDVSGRTSGTYQGILMFQSRDAITLQASPFILNSTASMKTEGAIYLPNGKLQFNSSGVSNLSSAAWTVLILRGLQLNSEAKVIVNTNYAAGPALPAELSGLRSPEGVRLIY